MQTISEGVTDKVCDADPVTTQAEILGTCEFPVQVGREQLAVAQRNDPTLTVCIAAADNGTVANKRVQYFWENDLLMRKWENGDSVHQVVIPIGYRSQILMLAHDHVLSGHLGIRKTYERILRYFFWPGLKSDVSAYCRSCHSCQLAGKPNQIIPPAPLRPIPVINEPFDRILIDCVGPLPKSKAGHQYILTIMCAATRYPEAIPMRSIKAKAVVKELIRFCSVFGLPKFIQTDQGSNFTSTLFSQILRELSVKHQLSSAYHPESQGALERFHQTLKSMLRTFCVETGRDWDDGLPLVMFAVRETVQESLGFSPAELVFGHTVRGPLKLLREQLVSSSSPPISVLDYVSKTRERLHNACEMARANLAVKQKQMKRRFDKRSVSRSFQVGDLVLVLLPIPGSALQARFSGPYPVEQKLSETDLCYSYHGP